MRRKWGHFMLRRDKQDAQHFDAFSSRLPSRRDQVNNAGLSLPSLRRQESRPTKKNMAEEKNLILKHRRTRLFLPFGHQVPNANINLPRGIQKERFIFGNPTKPHSLIECEEDALALPTPPHPNPPELHLPPILYRPKHRCKQ